MNNFKILDGVLTEYAEGEEKVILADNVTCIGDSVFYKHRTMECIYIPKSVKKIEKDAFMDCPNLKTVRYMGALENWLTIEFVGYYANPMCNEADLYIEGKLIKNLEIPESVKEVKRAAFAGCASLENVVIPGNVQVVGHNAFNECIHLKNVLMKDGVEKIDTGAFDSCKQLEKVVIPQSVTMVKQAFKGCENLTIYCEGDAHVGEFAENWNCQCPVVIEGGAGAFASEITEKMKDFKKAWAPDDGFEINEQGVLIKYYGRAEEVVIPNTVQTISERAFAECKNIKHVEIPYTVVAIEKEAFEKCINLTSVVVGDNVVEIGEYAFRDCGNLEKVVLGSSVEKLHSGAFFGCQKLKEINFPASLKRIGGWTFFSCAFSNITIPNGVETIGGYAFDSCNNITELVIPNSMQMIGFRAFWACKQLKKVTIPSSVITIQKEAFTFCDKLTIYYDGQKFPKTFDKEWNKGGGKVMIKDKNGNWKEYKQSIFSRLLGL